MKNTDEDMRRVSKAAYAGAMAAFQGSEFAVVVVVRQLPANGCGQSITTNIDSGRHNIAVVLEDAAGSVVRESTRIILPPGVVS